MARVTIHRSDSLPGVCVCCGEEKLATVQVRLAPKHEESLASKAFLPSILSLLYRVIPTCRWTLPFCERHYQTQRFFQNMQGLMLFVGFGSLLLSIWTFTVTNKTYEPLAEAIFGVLTLVISQYTLFAPTEVTRYKLTMGRVSDKFADQHAELNRLSDEIETGPEISFE